MEGASTRTRAIVAAVLCATLAVSWLSARAAIDDDRSVIIVRSGSLLFDNGTAAMPGSAWTKDSILDEWKPLDADYKSISGFAVRFEGVYAPSTCQSSTMTGEDVEIEYTKGGVTGGVVKLRVKKRRSHLLGLLGKHEPKVAENGNTLKVNTAINVPELIYADPTAGYISKVKVKGHAECAIPAPPDTAARLGFKVLIQPKAKEP